MTYTLAIGTNIVDGGVGGLALTWIIGFIEQKMAA